MESEHFVGKIAQKAIIERDGKILIVLDVRPMKWDLPGGRLHRNEEPSAGLERELREELGAEIRVGEPFDVGVFTGKDTLVDAHGDPHYVVDFRAHLTDPEKKFTLQQEEIGEVRWVGPSDLDTLPIIPRVKDVLERYFKS